MTGTYFLGEHIIDTAYKGDEAVYGRNLISDSNNFIFGWSNYQGATILRTPNQTVREWGATDATRIQTSGGTNGVKTHRSLSNDLVDAGEEYIFSIYIVNHKDEGMRVSFNAIAGNNVHNLPAGFAGRILADGVATGGNLQVLFNTIGIDNELDVTVWRLQLEKGNKDKVTSWSPAPEDLIGG